MNASTMKNFDVNESIQYNYYFFSYCIFISYFHFQNLPCNKHYVKFTQMVKEILEIFWDIIRGINMG